MSPRLASTFIALMVGLCLHASSALAQLSVTATQASGAPNTDVAVSLTVGAGGATDEVNLSAISAYTFNLLWDPTILSFNSYSSTVDLSASGPTLGAGSAVFDWFDASFSNPVSFAGGLSITANFHILNTAASGASTTIAFGDGLNSGLSSYDVDFNESSFSFSGVTQGNPMQVTVLSPSPVPEPAEISMMLAGLGIMALVLRRRRNQG